MKLVASLPWYDHPASSSSLDLFWIQLRNRLILNGLDDAPEELNRSTSLEEQWQDPGLIISQCCGPDLFTEPTDNVTCLGRPVFADLDCLPGYYFSHIVSRGELPPSPTAATNSSTSWSGNMALKQWLGERRISSSKCILSGSHQNSLELLQTGLVDVIAIDAHTWTLLDARNVKIIGRSILAKTPPFISGMTDNHSFKSISEALENTISSDGYRIGITGLIEVGKVEYSSIVPEKYPDIASGHKSKTDILDTSNLAVNFPS